MPRRKAEKGEVLKVVEEVLGGEQGEQYLTAINEIAKQLGKEPREVFQSLLSIGLKAYNWGSMTIPDLIVCVDVLGYLDEKFYRRIYVESPIEAVIRQADKFSEATRKILEGYGVMIKAKAEQQQQQQQQQEEAKPKQQQGGGVLDKVIDNIVMYISEELGARLSKDVVDAVEPELREVLVNMIREGKIRVEITGGELLRKTEEAGE
jgi:hypothetical protein